LRGVESLSCFSAQAEATSGAMQKSFAAQSESLCPGDGGFAQRIPQCGEDGAAAMQHVGEQTLRE